MKSFEEAQLQSHTLAQQLGCLSDVMQLLVYCLRFPFARHSIFNSEPRSKTTRELTTTATLARVSLPILDRTNPMSSFMYWSPVVDGVILVEQPTKSLFTENAISKPVIMGTVSHEIELFLKLFLRRPMTKSRLYQAAVKVTQRKTKTYLNYFFSLLYPTFVFLVKYSPNILQHVRVVALYKTVLTTFVA